jgi:hypothetical protein
MEVFMQTKIKSTISSTYEKSLFKTKHGNYAILMEYLDWDGSVCDHSYLVFKDLKEAEEKFEEIG